MSIADGVLTVDAKVRKNLDGLLVLFACLLAIIGLVALYSVGRTGGAGYFQRQVVWLAAGLMLMVLTALVQYNGWQRHATALYVVNLGLLALVIFAGSEVKGAVRWISVFGFQFQPSEFAKLALIVGIATFMARRRDTVDRFSTLAASLAYVGLPAVLVLRQPDLGTALSLGAIWFGIAFVAGARVHHLLLVALAALVAFGGMWKLGMVHDYQMNRLLVCVNPDADAQGAGYQVRQSRIAVGSGRLLGKGLGRGTQAHGRFIPERQTDFVFTVVAEEGGFLAAVCVVLLYTGVLLRGWRIAAGAADPFGRFLVAGVLSMLGFHVAVNLGMTVGIMPVTGVPLPLVSYGGSSTLVTWTGIGLMLSVAIRREALVF